MIDYARQRQAMVDSQIRVNDVTDPRILAAMGELPREKFVPAARAALAYIDEDVPLRATVAGKPAARYLMEPMVLARLVQGLSLTASDHVLDIGSASGYSAALMARLAASVVALEEDTEFVPIAKRLLASLGADNVKVVSGPLTAGAPKEGPYDAILLQGSVEIMPAALTDSLKDGGRLAVVVGCGRAAKAMLYLRTGKVVGARPVFDAAIPPLPGFSAPREFVF
jgi:protein-L-isoaspartate(D-aspartate) O-methyltransferase